MDQETFLGRAEEGRRSRLRLPVVKGHVVSLDGLRGIAVILTQLSHIVKRDHNRFRHSSARVGVAIFFVLSGFLITGVLLNLEASYRPSTSLRWPSFRHLPRFYVDRTVRLFPALFTMVMSTLAINFFFNGWPESTKLQSLLLDASYCLSYTTNLALFLEWRPKGGMWDNAWSLAVEEQFYIFWSLFLPIFMRLDRPARCSLLTILISFSLFIKYNEFKSVLHLGHQITHWTNPLGNIFKMLLGASLRIVPLPAVLHKWQAAYACLLLLALLQLHAWSNQPWTLKATPPTLFYELASSFLALPLLLSLVHRENALLSWQPLCFVGRISYAFYLYQVPLLNVGGWPRGYRGFTITVFAALCATASTFYVEEPIRCHYRRYRSRALSTQQDVI